MPDSSAPGGHFRWKLVLLDGPDAGQSFPVTGESITIGRELYNDIWLDDLHVSKNHARLTRQEQQLVIEDLHSINGTRVNDVPITEPYVLQEGDSISVGSFTFRVEREAVGIPQAQLQTRAYPVPPSQTAENRIPLLAGAIAGLILIIVLLAALGAYWLLSSPPRAAEQATATPAPVTELPKVVINQGPANDSDVELNRSVQVQATASDPSGITRMELWVNNRQVDAIISQLAQDVPSMTSVFEWTPDAPGTYTLDVRAYNQAGRISTVNVATLTVPGAPDTPTPAASDTPTPTITPLPPPPTATFTPLPSATPVPVTPTPTPEPPLYSITIPALNVREGPGTTYPVIGQLEQGDQAEIVGQADIGQGQWWQIRFDPAPGNLAWVSAQPGLGTASNSGQVPVVEVAPISAVATATLLATPTPAPAGPVLVAPAGKTLLVVSNRSLINQPARLTLSGGKSVGGGQEIDVAANSLVELVLEPDFYRAVWSSPYRSFARGADFTAVKDKVIVMWIVPEDGLSNTEIMDSYSPAARPTATPRPTSAAPTPAISGYTAPPGKALLVVANRSLANRFGLVTVSGGSFGGGEQITLDANTEMPLELQPGNYRTIWSAPGFTAGREFRASAGEVILGWIIPEEERVFMQFPGQDPIQINN